MVIKVESHSIIIGCSVRGTLNNLKGGIIVRKINTTKNEKRIKVKNLIDTFYKVKGDKITESGEIDKRIRKWIRPYFEDLYTDEIDRELLFKWYSKLSENLGAYLIKKTTNVLKEILDIGVDFYDLNENLARKFKFEVKSKAREVKIWTKEEFEVFIEKVLDPHYYIFYQILFNTGMELGEIRGLQFKDINLKTGAVTVNKKLQYVNGEYIYQSIKTTPNSRTIFLSKKILNEFKEYLNGIGNYRRDDRIFFLTPHKYKKHLEAVCKMYGLEPIKLQAFRFSFATELINQGVPVNYVSKWLGHSKVITTLNFYIPNSEKSNRYILDFLNR